MKHTPATFETKGHVVLTGFGTGPLTLRDGTVYDVTAPVVEVDPAHADELAHLIGVQVEVQDLHPAYDAAAADDPKDPRTKFVHVPARKFAKYVPHADNGFEG